MEFWGFFDERLDNLRSVRQKTIPYQNHETVNLAGQVLEKFQDQLAISIGIGMKSEEQNR